MPEPRTRASRGLLPSGIGSRPGVGPARGGGRLSRARLGRQGPGSRSSLRGMAERKVIVLACDYCGAEGDKVRRRDVSVDDGVLELEACGRCWKKATADIAKKARLRKRRRTSRA